MNLDLGLGHRLALFTATPTQTLARTHMVTGKGKVADAPKNDSLRTSEQQGTVTGAGAWRSPEGDEQVVTDRQQSPGPVCPRPWTKRTC